MTSLYSTRLFYSTRLKYTIHNTHALVVYPHPPLILQPSIHPYHTYISPITTISQLKNLNHLILHQIDTMADISFDYFDHPQNRQVRCRLSISVLSLPSVSTILLCTTPPGLVKSGALALALQFIWHMSSPPAPLTSPHLHLISAHSSLLSSPQSTTLT